MRSNNKDAPPKALLGLTAQVVSAYLGKNQLPTQRLGDVIRTVHGTLATMGNEGVSQAGTPAVPVKQSVTPEFIVCLEDGRKVKMLRRYLRKAYNMTPLQYRSKWGLPATYPMVAPNYTKTRSLLAKKIGLGQHERKAH